MESALSSNVSTRATKRGELSDLDRSRNHRHKKACSTRSDLGASTTSVHVALTNWVLSCKLSLVLGSWGKTTKEGMGGHETWEIQHASQDRARNRALARTGVGSGQ